MKRLAIIGGGISGLSAAYFLQKQSEEVEIHLYEAQDRLGGVIKTDVIEGCSVDCGPDSFLTQKKAGITLCEELGLEASLIGSNDSVRKTFLFHEGILKPLPEGFFLMVPTRLLPFITTSLLSWTGKFSAMSDLLMPPEKEDCTVSEFIERRFGREILQQIAEPLVAGIYGADVNRLSAMNALPQIWELQKKGSMVLNLLRFRASLGAVPAESLFTALVNGMESLVEALQKRCSKVQWKLGFPVARIEKERQWWRIGSESYDVLLIATSSLPEIATEKGAQIRRLIQSVRRNSAIVAVLGFENSTREGFGWLVPAPERRSVLACTYLNNKFPRQYPGNRFLLRVFIGGDNAAEWIGRSEAEIHEEVIKELKRIAGIHETPVFSRIYKWKDTMPEYAVGHADLVATVNELAGLEGNLYLTGNMFSGVGIPDCIRHAEKTAAEIVARIGREEG